MKMRNAALELARRFHVLPLWSVEPDPDCPSTLRCGCEKGDDCKSPGKHPMYDKELIPNGVKDATQDPELIKRMWEKYPNANIGIATGRGLFVLDLDPRNGAEQSLATLLKEHGRLPRTLAVDTGGSGKHFYLAGDARNSAKVLGPGLDTRGEGGLVVAPPSLHISGKRYAWRGAPDTPIAPLPKWIASALRPRARASSNGHAAPICELDTESAISQGGRWLASEAPEAIEGHGGNETTYKVAAHVKDFGISEGKCVDLMLDHWNGVKAFPPWEPEDLEQIVGNAYRYGTLPAGVKNAAAEFETVTVAGASAFGPLTIREWLDANLPEPDPMLGSWLTTTSRVLLVAATGLGKTNFSMQIGMSVAAGADFLHWRGGGRPRRVLYIDGEMSSRLLRQRIRDAAERLGAAPATFFAFSHENLEGFAPLNTKAGQDCVERLIKKLGGVDLIIFDSVMCLTVGDMKDEESWQETLPWARSLTRRSIGQIWVHHTGHDATRSYGTKTREWQLDTVIVLEAAERPDTDVSFTIGFSKARERTPVTRADFLAVNAALVDGVWEFTQPQAKKMKVTPLGGKFLSALRIALADNGSGGCALDAWKEECAKQGLLSTDNAKSARSLFDKYKRELIAANQVACNEGSVRLRDQTGARDDFSF